MLKNSQAKFVEEHLRISGNITRNYCLTQYISRLSAIICDMNSKGYIISGERVPVTTKWGKGFDYRYTIIKQPKDPVYK